MTKNQRGAVIASLMVFGLLIGGWGWDKHVSTIMARTHGSVTMMILGALMFVVGFIWLCVSAGGSRR